MSYRVVCYVTLSTVKTERHIELSTTIIAFIVKYRLDQYVINVYCTFHVYKYPFEDYRDSFQSLYSTSRSDLLPRLSFVSFTTRYMIHICSTSSSCTPSPIPLRPSPTAGEFSFKLCSPMNIVAPTVLYENNKNQSAPDKKVKLSQF